MKRELRNGCLVGVALGVAVASAAGCRPRKQSNWRTPPAAPAACTSDAECGPGGTCGIELGATQGTCSHPGGVGGFPGTGADAGGPPLRGPDVRPLPSDIQI